MRGPKELLRRLSVLTVLADGRRLVWRVLAVRWPLQADPLRWALASLVQPGIGLRVDGRPYETWPVEGGKFRRVLTGLLNL